MSSTTIHANELLNKYESHCIMYDVHARASSMLRTVKSDHFLVITNTASNAQTYHVEYLNYILYDGKNYSPNGKSIFDVTLQSGETREVSNTISKDAYFSLEGTYPLICTTKVKLNNKEVSSIQSKNYAYIE